MADTDGELMGAIIECVERGPGQVENLKTADLDFINDNGFRYESGGAGGFTFSPAQREWAEDILERLEQ